MRERYTKDTIPKKYQYIFNTPIYKSAGHRAGAGYKKFNIISIWINLKEQNQIVNLELRGTTWKSISKNILVKFAFEEEKIETTSLYFIDLVDWFISSHKVISNIGMLDEKCYSQFMYEYYEIKAKNPEYFL